MIEYTSLDAVSDELYEACSDRVKTAAVREGIVWSHVHDERLRVILEQLCYQWFCEESGQGVSQQFEFTDYDCGVASEQVQFDGRTTHMFGSARWSIEREGRYGRAAGVSSIKYVHLLNRPIRLEETLFPILMFAVMTELNTIVNMVLSSEKEAAPMLVAAGGFAVAKKAFDDVVAVLQREPITNPLDRFVFLSMLDYGIANEKGDDALTISDLQSLFGYAVAHLREPMRRHDTMPDNLSSRAIRSAKEALMIEKRPDDAFNSIEESVKRLISIGYITCISDNDDAKRYRINYRLE